jgi:subtilase family serine protease
MLNNTNHFSLQASRSTAVFRFKSVLLLSAAVAFVLTFNLASNAEAKRALITQKIDESQLTTLLGNTRPEANAFNDRGPVSADLQMDHMLLLLKRAPELDSALEQFIEDQHNPKSPNFHQWLSAAQFGERYGLVHSDLAAITGWLEGYGFQVNVVYSNNILIDFSGTASQVENAFHTQIREYMVNGVSHIANASDPKIPTALASAVIGPVSLNDFRPRAMNKRIKAAHIDPNSGSEVPDYTAGGGYPLVPYDLEKIYNIAPLLSAGISGQGMKIVVIEDTNLYNCNASNGPGPCSATSDWSVFRNTFGLGRYTAGNLSQENPAPQTGANNCTNPGDNSDDVEAAIDVEWSTAAAPSASIVNAACADTRTTFGGLIALQNILSHPNADNVDVVSISYGEAETLNGAAANAAYNTTYQQAVTAGIGIFVSSGDEDAASAGTRDGITVS